MINVLIVDDERNIQKAFRSDVIAAADKYCLVDVISSAGNAEAVCTVKQVDLILMDVNTANNESGLIAAAKIKRRFPDTKIIITTSYMDFRAIREAHEAGVESFWFKDFSPIELLDVMERTVAGGSYYPEETPDVMLGLADIKEFTPTEMQVLYLLLEYVSVKKIAEKLSVEDVTVKTHLQHMCQKAGCANKAELAVLAANAKLVLPKLRDSEQDRS